MTLTSSELTFTWTPATLVFGIVLVLATAAVSFIIWKRNNFSRSTFLLELLRVIIVALVAITLNQPEWREVFEPDDKPVIAVLHDESGSMATADILDPDKPATAPRTRTESISEIIKPEAWQEIGDDVDLVFQSFSSKLEKPTEGSDIGQALDDLLEQYPNLRGVFLASDGDWNTGDPPAKASTRLRMRDIPVFALPVGSETKLPDIAVVGFDVPTFAITGKPVRLPFTIESSLPRDHSVLIEMTSDNGDSLNKEITIPAMGRVQDTFSWKPGINGDTKLTLTVPSSDEELNSDNNEITAPIAIRKEELKVLLIETFPRWEYRYLRNALERDPGVVVNCLLFHPSIEANGGGPGYLDEFPTPDKLAEFDVIFLGDVGVGPKMLTDGQAELLKKQVANQASGLVFLPGLRGNQISLLGTGLSDLLPIIPDEAQPRGWGSPNPGQFELTDLGIRSLLTRLEDTENENANIWGSLPGFQWFAGVERAKAGTEVLATHSSESNRYGRIPLIVTKTYGTGKVLFMGTDGAWRWRKGVEDKYHYRFWGQVARWMAYQRSMASGKSMRLFYSPDRPQSGDVLTLNANVMSIGGEPLQSATVITRITAPSGAVESLRLRSGGEDQWGLFTAAFSPNEPGDYEIQMTCTETGATLETKISVQGTILEKTGDPIRVEVLDEIARITRGELIERPDMSLILAKISALPEPEAQERRLRLWAHPFWIAIIVLLMVVFWIGRKVIGAV